MFARIDFFTVVVAVLILLGAGCYVSCGYFTLRRSIYVNRTYPEFRKKLDTLMREEILHRPWNIFNPWKTHTFVKSQYVDMVRQFPDEALQDLLAKEEKCWRFWIVVFKVFGPIFVIASLAYFVYAWA